MTINIAHLYFDLLNLYGESGNVKSLKKYYEEAGIKVNIKFLTISDELDLENIDIIYIGSGTEKNQKIVLKHILKYKKQMKNYIESNKLAIITGNSTELFGKVIIGRDKKYKALNIFNYSAKEEEFRIVDEALFKSNLINDYIIGFQNQSGTIRDIQDNHLFEVVKGTGSFPKSKNEGYLYKNFYGSYLIGPLLVRNPKLLEYIANKVIKDKDKDYKFKKVNLKLEKKAYKNFINNYYSEYIK